MQENEAETTNISAEILAMVAAVDATLDIATASALRTPSRRTKRKAEKKNERQKEKKEIKNQFSGCGYAAQLTSEEERDATLSGAIPSAVVDSGASSTCVKGGGRQATVRMRAFRIKGATI